MLPQLIRTNNDGTISQLNLILSDLRNVINPNLLRILVSKHPRHTQSRTFNTVLVDQILTNGLSKLILHSIHVAAPGLDPLQLSLIRRIMQIIDISSLKLIFAL